MFKHLIKLFLENRLNNIAEKVEQITEKLIEEEDEVMKKGKIAQATFQISQEALREVKKMKTRVEIYEVIFGKVKVDG